MSVNQSLVEGAAAAERRRHDRFPVALPGTIQGPRGEASALIHDIGSGGAMIETELHLWPGAPVIVRCGTIEAQAIVTRRANGLSGLTFRANLSKQEVEQQVERSRAIAARRLNHPFVGGAPQVLA